MRSFVWLALVASLVIGPSPARASVREADDTLADMRAHRFLENARGLTSSFPGALASNRDLYVLCTAGAACGDLLVLARPNVPSRSVASALEAALSNAGYVSPAVVWSAEDDYACARFRWSRARFLSRRASQRLPVGAVADGLRHSGYEPHTMVRVLPYVRVSATPYLRVRGRNYTWLDATSARGASAIEMTGELSGGALVLVIAFFAWVPGIAFASLGVAAAVGVSSRIPLERRRRLYMRIVTYPTFGAIAVHAPCVIFFLRGPFGRAASDLWLGSPSLTAATPLIMGPVLVLMVVMPVVTMLERRLFGAADAEKAVDANMDEGERSLRKRLRRESMVWSLLMFTAISLIWVVPSDRYALAGGTAFAIIATSVLLSMLRIRRFVRRQKEMGLVWEDPVLLEEARGIAAGLGTTIRSVTVDRTANGKTWAAAMAPGFGRVTLSQKLVEEFTDSERRFVVAHEVAHSAGQHLKKRLALLALCMCCVLPLALAPLLLRTGVRVNPTFLFGVGMAGMVGLFFGTTAAARRREAECDRKALQATGDVDAAVSALEKLARCSPAPAIHEHALNASHPAMSRRIEALRRHTGMQEAVTEGRHTR